MTTGEQMVWAAAYAAAFSKETEHRPRDTFGDEEADARFDDWQTRCAVVAIETATTAVWRLRCAGPRLLEEASDESRAAHEQMTC